MKRKIQFFAGGTFGIIAEAYFFSGLLASFAPSIVVVMLYLATIRFSLQYVLLLALWFGFVFDIISLHSFGLYTAVAVAIGAIVYWLHSKGFASGSFVGTALTIATGAYLFGFISQGFVHFPQIYVAFFSGFKTAFVTVIFAWFLNKLVQLEA